MDIKERFLRSEEKTIGFADIQIIRDEETGIEYLVLCNAVGGMILLDKRKLN